MSVKGNELSRVNGARNDDCVQRDALPIHASFDRGFVSRVIDQDAPHGFRRRAKEMA